MIRKKEASMELTSEVMDVQHEAQTREPDDWTLYRGVIPETMLESHIFLEEDRQRIFGYSQRMLRRWAVCYIFSRFCIFGLNIKFDLELEK
eukprot:snap_masked-scaffold_11-processed-gene-7.34-mRNA-1 protein AED:1.00 eAED:1.00 QI:0/0/0/0/1/1/2/0/90